MPGAPASSRSWPVLASLCFGRFCLGLQLQYVAALTPFLMADVGYSFTAIGLLIGLFLAPGVVLALPSSLLCAHFGYRQLGLAGLVMMALGSLWLSFSESFWFAAGARLLGGTGGILLNVAFLRLTTVLFEGKAYNRAIAVVMSSWTVGIGLAAISLPFLAELGDWRLPIWLVSGLTLAAALCVRLFVPDRGQDVARGGTLWPLRLDRRSFRLSFYLGSAFACFTAGGIVFISFAPPFLMANGLGLAEANAVASLIVWLGLIGTPLGGWLADRSGDARPVIYAGALGCALVMVLLVSIPVGWPALLLGLLLGISWGFPAAPFTGLLQRMLPSAALGAGYGLYFTLFYSGFFLFPALAGWLVDLTSSTASALWFAASLLAVTAILTATFYRAAARPSEG